MAVDLRYLKASDGTGSAVLAHVDTARIAGSTSLSVDSVSGWDDYFIATSGTLSPSGYILEAGKTEFKGHLDSGNIIIDSFEPGFTDIGNTTSDVVIIKQTTGWADGVAEAMQVSHNNDGTLKTGIVTDGKVANGISTAKLAVPYRFSGHRAAAQTIPSGVESTVLIDSVDYNIGNTLDIVTNKGRFTAPVSGLYHFSWSAAGITSGAGFSISYLFKNNAAYKQGSKVYTSISTGVGSTGSASAMLTAGDYIELRLFLNGTQLEVGPFSCWFQGHLVSTT